MSFKIILSLLHVVVMTCASVEILTYIQLSVARLHNITHVYNYQRKGRNTMFQLIMCMLSMVIHSHCANAIKPHCTVPCSTVAITVPARYGSTLVHTAILTVPYRTVPCRAWFYVSCERSISLQHSVMHCVCHPSRGQTPH